ncbi:hypothetical protein JI435_418440 [Parastagonospora nodorum SN15]|uniref:Uncharacterized protein n=1 Tax=Phaeosphaeria nodorum (strain SN15 / ATCC MYA-4574 / FGSC 10173) TaxID=321614 RepID=A0A7U2I5M7_PHANO|nr:hypothetical protein JI435_418440 [Parastagonospora nodorum SN15]
MFDVRKAERRVRWQGRIRRGCAARKHWTRGQRWPDGCIRRRGRGRGF